MKWWLRSESLINCIQRVSKQINDAIREGASQRWEVLQEALIALLSSQELANYLTPFQFARKARDWQVQSIISKYLGRPSITVPIEPFNLPLDIIEKMYQQYRLKQPDRRVETGLRPRPQPPQPRRRE